MIDMKCIARIVMCLMVASGIGACGGGDSASDVRTLGYYTAGQSGTSVSPWGDGSSSANPAMAVKFTPAAYPLTARSVTLYATNNTGSAQQFNLYGYSDLAAETPLFSPVLNQSVPYTGTSKTAVTVTISDTAITSGSFYIAVEWVTKPLSSVSGANAFFLCTDSTLDYPSTGFIRFSGTTWASLESTSAIAGDPGIVVHY